MMQLIKKHKACGLIIVMTVLFFCFSGTILLAGVKPGMTFKDGRLTLEATGAPLLQVLELLSQQAGVDVFVAKGFQAGNVTFQVADEPLEDALKSILQGYNYAAVYAKEGDVFRVAALKIYPEGSQQGEMTQVFTGIRSTAFTEVGKRGETRTVLVSSGDEVITHNSHQKTGLLAPSRMELNVPEGQSAPVNAPWFQLQAQMERQEAGQYEELMVLQKRLESADNPDLKKSLSMIYADQLAKFQNMKQVNLNKVESLKRISQFREITGQ